MSLLVICPSHVRPTEATAVDASFRKTKTTDAELQFLVWENDAFISKYPENTVGCPEQAMTDRCNGYLDAILDYQYVGWVADDNRFETAGWDERVIAALQGNPIVFCNDRVSPGSKPSHVFMDTRIVKALGWIHHPGLIGTFGDDVWANLGVGPIDVSRPLFGDVQHGERSGGLGITYLGDVQVPHYYVERDNSVSFRKDIEVYQKWLRHDAEDDIAKCKRALRKVYA